MVRLHTDLLKKDTITREEMEQIQDLIDNAYLAMHKINILTGKVNFGCDYDEEEKIFYMWNDNTNFQYKVIEKNKKKY